MGFLAPWFLAGIAALGIPIYVHLLRQYKSKPLPFSSLMFFEQRIQSSVKHRKLKYLLLFALRCLFVALLVLAFARPFVHSDAVAKATGAKTVILALDNSFSMRQGGRFAKAKEAALTELAKLGTGDRAQAVTFGGNARLLTGMTTDKAELRGALQAVEPGDGASSYADLSRILRSTVQSLHTPIEARVFTDLQKSSMPASFADLKLEDGTKLEIFPVAKDMVPNWTIESVDAPSRVFDTRKVRTLATIAGFNTEEATKKVSLLTGGKVLETKTVKIPANGRATVEFLALEAPYGLSRGEIRLDAGDAFPEDDHWYFAVERADPKPALLIHSDSDASSTVYIRTALDASNEPAFTLDPIATSQAANTNLGKYSFVILSDTGPLAEKLENNLRDYVQKGGSILVALGKNSVPGRKIPVAGLQVAGVHFVAPDKERSLTVASVDASYPSFARGTNWDGVEFFLAARVLLPENGRDVRIAARLSDGTPLLLDQNLGEGHVLIFASAFDNIANNLPLQPVWIPFIEQTTHEIGGIGASRGVYKVGAYVELRSAREKGVPVEVIGPDGKRALTLSESAKANIFQFPAQGFWDIKRANGHEELAAVNPDRKESDFALIPEETLTLWKNTGLAPVTSTKDGGAAGKDTGEKSELWWYVLVALLLLALAESVLGNRHLGTDDPQVVKKEAA